MSFRNCLAYCFPGSFSRLVEFRLINSQVTVQGFKSALCDFHSVLVERPSLPSSVVQVLDTLVSANSTLSSTPRPLCLPGLHPETCLSAVSWGNDRTHLFSFLWGSKSCTACYTISEKSVSYILSGFLAVYDCQA